VGRIAAEVMKAERSQDFASILGGPIERARDRLEGRPAAAREQRNERQAWAVGVALAPLDRIHHRRPDRF